MVVVILFVVTPGGIWVTRLSACGLLPVVQGLILDHGWSPTLLHVDHVLYVAAVSSGPSDF